MKKLIMLAILMPAFASAGAVYDCRVRDFKSRESGDVMLELNGPKGRVKDDVSLRTGHEVSVELYFERVQIHVSHGDRLVSSAMASDTAEHLETYLADVGAVICDRRND